MMIAIPITSRNRIMKTRKRPRRTNFGSSMRGLYSCLFSGKTISSPPVLHTAGKTAKQYVNISIVLIGSRLPLMANRNKART
jgi:hypothetical protein